MPHVDINGTRLWVTDSGGTGEPVFFVHGLLMNGRMFDHQVTTLSDQYRCITVDLRGQGKSDVPDSGYDIENLTADIVELINYFSCGPVHYAGLSMGGFIGLRLAIRNPQMLRSLTLMNSSADPQPAHTLRKYRFLLMIGKLFGFRPMMNTLMKIKFGETFLTNPQTESAVQKWRQRQLDTHRAGAIRATQGVLERAGVVEDLDKIVCPTLIIAGAVDAALPVADSERMHAAINGSELQVLEAVGHSAPIEQPEKVSRLMSQFLAKQTNKG